MIALEEVLEWDEWLTSCLACWRKVNGLGEPIATRAHAGLVRQSLTTGLVQGLGKLLCLQVVRGYVSILDVLAVILSLRVQQRRFLAK